MLDISHILVLSQDMFLRRRIRAVMGGGLCGRSSRPPADRAD